MIYDLRFTNVMNKQDLIARTKTFAINVYRLCDKLPDSVAGNIYKRQLLRCSSSVGANYRAACRAKSSADFINKLKIVEEETDESVYFLELLLEVNHDFKAVIDPLRKEGNELLAIFVASIKTIRNRTIKSN